MLLLNSESPEGKSLEIDKLSQNRPYTNYYNYKFDIDSKKAVLGFKKSPLEDYPLRKSFISWCALANKT